MITFHYDTSFILNHEKEIIQWIKKVIEEEGYRTGEINYIFCDDRALNKINVSFLRHDNYTDIVSFDYTVKNVVNGDMYISVDRVKENALKYNVTFANEMHRVMIHGALHCLGYKDKTKEEISTMRAKEDKTISMLMI